MDFRGVKIAWIRPQSNKYPSLYTSIKIYTHWAILRGKHPRISASPNQFLKSEQKFQNWFPREFPGNRVRIVISPESTWFTESVQSFWNRKMAHIQNLCSFLYTEFNLPNWLPAGGLNFDIKLSDTRSHYFKFDKIAVKFKHLLNVKLNQNQKRLNFWKKRFLPLKSGFHGLTDQM